MEPQLFSDPRGASQPETNAAAFCFFTAFAWEKRWSTRDISAALSLHHVFPASARRRLHLGGWHAAGLSRVGAKIFHHSARSESGAISRLLRFASPQPALARVARAVGASRLSLYDPATGAALAPPRSSAPPDRASRRSWPPGGVADIQQQRHRDLFRPPARPLRSFHLFQRRLSAR